MAARRLALSALAFASPLVVLAACGGGAAPKAPGHAPRGADAGAEAAAPPAPRPPPTGLPPLATMPPPGVAGSKKAAVKLDAALGACAAGVTAASKDPASHVKKLGEACAASRQKPVGAVLRGAQSEKDAHQEGRFHAEANHCYRILLATDEGIQSAAAILRDSAGNVIVEGPAPMIPGDGAACFREADDVTVLVAVGAGKGAWVAQVYGD